MTEGTLSPTVSDILSTTPGLRLRDTDGGARGGCPGAAEDEFREQLP